MDKRILWFDVETGGTDEKTDALLQLAAIIEINNEIVDSIDLKMQPVKGKNISSEAIATHGMTLEMIKEFPVSTVAHKHFEDFLLKHNKYPSKSSRYIMAGYNADFDCRFLSQWYLDITCGPYDYWKHLQFSPIDVLPTLRAMRYAGLIDTMDTKLETVCKYFGIEIKAHDALDDVKATRELTHLVFDKLWTLWAGKNCSILGSIPEVVVT